MKPRPNSLHQPKTAAFGTKTLGLSLTPQTSAVPLLMSQHKHKKKDSAVMSIFSLRRMLVKTWPVVTTHNLQMDQHLTTFLNLLKATRTGSPLTLRHGTWPLLMVIALPPGNCLLFEEIWRRIESTVS
jgi:hypothetical protein